MAGSLQGVRTSVEPAAKLLDEKFAAGSGSEEDPARNAYLALPTVAGMRVSYESGKLDLEELHSDPIEQFRRWFSDASAAGIYEPNAMCLATCTRDGRPSSRMVLLKGISEAGFSFFTNYGSRKGRELGENPQPALTFWWGPLSRQVRVEGLVRRVSEAESSEYFSSRPRDSQLGAVASKQSEVIASREALEVEVKRLAKEFGDASRPVARPAYWGGFLVQPRVIEFWHGRVNRLHDRLRYSQLPHDEAGAVSRASRWKIERLSP